nr:DNA helicase [Tanacetum cinerariifolium]
MLKYPHLTASDRANVVCRVFEQKIQALIAFLKEERIFGEVTGAELPDPRIDPEGYNVVLELMMHGPCGTVSLKAYWRILKFDIHRCEPAVQILAVRSEDMQRITFRDQDRDFWEVQTVNDVFYQTYKAKCQALGLLGDDKDLIFVYGHGGTGKTFLWKTIISSLRSEGKIVLAVASSGIASLLLPSGRIAHSRFKLPLELTEESLCGITKYTQLGKLLADIDLIIWDEAPMNDRRCFEALDISLRDIVDNPSSLFGEKSVLLGGDFRQTLPVKKGTSKIEVISSCISESALWPSFKVFTLKHNIRLARPDISLKERSLVNSFASWLLDVGDGKIGEPADEDPENRS